MVEIDAITKKEYKNTQSALEKLIKNQDIVNKIITYEKSDRADRKIDYENTSLIMSSNGACFGYQNLINSYLANIDPTRMEFETLYLKHLYYDTNNSIFDRKCGTKTSARVHMIWT